MKTRFFFIIHLFSLVSTIATLLAFYGFAKVFDVEFEKVCSLVLGPLIYSKFKSIAREVLIEQKGGDES
jgi:hypothetical protein